MALAMVSRLQEDHCRLARVDLQTMPLEARVGPGLPSTRSDHGGCVNWSYGPTIRARLAIQMGLIGSWGIAYRTLEDDGLRWELPIWRRTDPGAK
jgi:hypothetical protein